MTKTASITRSCEGLGGIGKNTNRKETHIQFLKNLARQRKKFAYNVVLNQFIQNLRLPPTWKDFLICSALAVAITFNPYYLKELNVFELGLYLPGINAIFHGAVPFRDFFHLRGPLDLYMPALLMAWTKMHVAVICAYFYVGNVLCLLLTLLIAKDLLKTRYMLYVLAPAVITRTFPRVMFMFWGGMRYAFGLLAIWCFVRYLKTLHGRWAYAAGATAALGLLTSMEMGVYAAAGIIIALIAALVLKTIEGKSCIRALLLFLAGMATLLLPWLVYAAANQALVPYVHDTLAVVLNMQKIIDPHAASIYPRNLPEALAAMLNTHSVNFKQMTPSYIYIAAALYLGWRCFRRKLDAIDVGLLALAIYGFIMYNTAFRGIWTAHFEMALMPEKIIYFWLGEALLLGLWTSRQRLQPTVAVVLAILFLVSAGYGLGRCYHRCFAFHPSKYSSHKGLRRLNMDRAKGVLVPSAQADELEAVDQFLKAHSTPQDVVVMFPELGAYNFLADRPFLGQFPITTFSWFDDGWFEEYLGELRTAPVKYIFVQKKLAQNWSPVYFAWKPNRIKYARMLAVIRDDYEIAGETPKCIIYARKSPS